MIDCIVRRFTTSHFLVLEAPRSRYRPRRALLVPAHELARACEVIGANLDWRSDDLVSGFVPLELPAGLGNRKAISAAEGLAREAQAAQGTVQPGQD